MKANDPYTSKKVTANAYAKKVPLEAKVVAVLRGTVADRGWNRSRSLPEWYQRRGA